MNDMSRREALVLAGACACCAMSADPAVAADSPPAAVKSLAIGTLADYPKPGFYDKFKASKVLVSRLDDRLVVMTTVCPHKGCAVRVKPGDEPALKCPCHKAEFSPQGTPTDGPAKTALVRYAIARAPDGALTADLTKSFIESKWDDPAAFVPIKGV